MDVDPPQVAPDHAILSDSQFARVSSLAMARYGLDLPDRKRQMVTNRLSKLRRVIGLSSLEELIVYMQEDSSPEGHLQLFDVLSTNLTHFFREREHIDLLCETLRSTPDWRKLRVWSAGCSKGCEPYSIVMALLEAFSDLERRDFKLLASDFALSVLQTARTGEYPPEMTRDLDAETRSRYFKSVPGGHSLLPSVRAPIKFALLNLMEPWPMKGPFDAIYCRNVMIYFDKPTREALTRRFVSLLRPGGLFFLGSSESLTGNHEELLRIAPSSYRRT